MKRRVLTYPTPFGDAWIEYDSDGVAALGLPGIEPPAVPAGEAPEAIRDVAASLTEYWDGAPLPEAPVAVMERASTTNLMARIYEVVTSIPAGSTLTYAEVARRAGRPGRAGRLLKWTYVIGARRSVRV